MALHTIKGISVGADVSAFRSLHDTHYGVTHNTGNKQALIQNITGLFIKVHYRPSGALTIPILI